MKKVHVIMLLIIPLFVSIPFLIKANTIQEFEQRLLAVGVFFAITGVCLIVSNIKVPKGKISVTYFLHTEKQLPIGTYSKTMLVDAVPAVGTILTIDLCTFVVEQVRQDLGERTDKKISVWGVIDLEEGHAWREGIDNKLLELGWQKL
ncbi:MAG TPA: hypothetical protein VG621_03485 [Candidatus Paceibacterota bacterium]|nr:hypothetical protein [Candidatus Paceibacterota bacterium]